MVNINVLGVQGITPSLTTPEQSIAFMESMNRAFVTDASQRASLKSVFLELAKSENPAIYNCTAGKDRTGWVSAVLGSIAGASSATIMKDYLASNIYSAKSIEATLSNLPAAYRAIYTPVYTVQANYLQAGLDQVTASYGSMNNYLQQGLGLTQADIYVLRGKLVNYLTLPGQAGLSGNAAAGAALLNNLQGSNLSGHYTAYNYYLQSAIDAGTLGGVENRVGGQIHADAAAYLSRQPQLIDDAIAPHITGRNLKTGETRVWLSGIIGYMEVSGSNSSANSNNNNAGFTLGATHRISDNASAYLGFADIDNNVRSADGSADMQNYLAVLGGRYALTNLETGFYVDGHLTAGGIDYKTNRTLGQGLGNAYGKANGYNVSFRANLGNIFDYQQFRFIPQLGIRTVHIGRDAFNETGSELALSVNSYSKTSTALLTDFTFELKNQQIGNWHLVPQATLGFERSLSAPGAMTEGSVLGYNIKQHSAYDSHNLGKFGISVSAHNGPWKIQAGGNTLVGDGLKGVAGAAVNVGYTF